ncbi:DNA excision repair protein [Acrasis kona]|uniref:DNA excision repair protein n=1 Tax=Acrasis kona TaxID=1008807 RepID=A0AAW2YN39_9EUKA
MPRRVIDDGDDGDGDDVTITSSMRRISITKQQEQTPRKQDDTKELKRRYNKFVEEARSIEKSQNPDIEECIELYEEAYALFQTDPKLLKKIENLKAQLNRFTKHDENFTFDRVDKVYILNHEHTPQFCLPSSVFDKLYDYQKFTMIWFWKKHLTACKEKMANGGILGDDMGLGKTVQVVSFLYGLFYSKQCKRALICMPMSVLQNWKNEFERWCPQDGYNSPRIYMFHKVSGPQRTKMLDSLRRSGGILLTTYGMVVSQINRLAGRDEDAKSGSEEEEYEDPINFDYVILDEGHKIKNSEIKLSACLRRIKTKFGRFILSGTPIQNNLCELWSLYDWIFQGRLLGDKRNFTKHFESTIVKASEKDATPYEVKLGNEVSKKLRSLIEPHLLRRDKSILKKNNVSITNKNDVIVWVRMSSNQIKMYKEFIAGEQVRQVLNNSQGVLAAITYLKQICTHPRLLHNNMLDRTLIDHRTQNSLKHMIEESGKLTVLNNLLHNIFVNEKDQSHKLLIFSQSSKMLDMIEKVLEKQQLGFLRIDGTVTDSATRQNLINKFNEPGQTDYCVFLLTAQTGGVGITLTAANRVVIFDPSWNPATDNQAVDRAYRIGQKRDVLIYRFITCGTIEEKIYRKQVFKGALSRVAIDSKEAQYRYFTHGELKDLFWLDNNGEYSNTQRQLAQIHLKQVEYKKELKDHLYSLNQICVKNISGFSDHNLLFTKDEVLHSELVNAMQVKQEVVRIYSTLTMRSSAGNSNEGERVRIPKKKKEPSAPAPVVTVPDVYDDLKHDVFNVDSDDESNDSAVEQKRKSDIARRVSIGLGLGTDSDEEREEEEQEEERRKSMVDLSNEIEDDSVPVSAAQRQHVEEVNTTEEESLLQYQDLVTNARISEINGDLISAINMYMDALMISSDDIKLHCKIALLGKELQFCA